MLLGWFALPFCVPLPPALLADPAGSPVIRDRHGVVIARTTLPGALRSHPVDATELPADLGACTVAAEDKRFHDHGGVDLVATARAVRDLVRHRRVISGASTISQQLIKISSNSGPRGTSRKLYEALAARRLEMTWDKPVILAAYLNRLDYGNLRIGAAEAARFYFQKPLADLSLAECATLAGLPQAPSRLDPLRHPARALARRNVVLGRLAALGGTDPARIERARAEPLSIRPLAESSPAPWLGELTASADLPTAQDIRTTLDLSIQRDLETIVREEVARLRESNLRHAAVVAIENHTGDILALVSSADWNDPRGGQINGAFTPRSPGSTLKPFTYLLALDRGGRTPASILSDIPTPFRSPEGLDLPENYDRAYRGPVTLRSALACSLNVPAMRELNRLGGPAPLHQLLRTLGLTTLGNDPDAHGLGLTLGNAPVKLIELTNAYATLARGGRHVSPILFAEAPAPAARTIAASPHAIHLVTDILADADARAPSFPPGGPLDLPFRCAVKTGTSSDFRDNWCVGFTPEFTLGVWAGNFENQPMKQLSGVAGAAPIFHRAMRRLHRESPPTEFAPPPGLIRVRIDRRNGLAIAPGLGGAFAVDDLAPPTRVPRGTTAADYDPQGRALLDPTYSAWFEGPHNHRRNELAMHPSQAPAEPLRVISPADGATFLLDPDIPARSDRLHPLTNLPGLVRWSSPTLRIVPGSPEPVIELVPGTHAIHACDTRDGSSRTLTIHVKQL